MSETSNRKGPLYLDIEGEDGEGWKIMVWDDPQGELDKVQRRIDSGEVFTSVTVNTTRQDPTTVDFSAPVVSCQLLPLTPTTIRGTVEVDGDMYSLTVDEVSR